MPSTTSVNHTVAGAAGAMISSTSDLLRFWRALQAGELLAAAELVEMHHTVPVNDEGDIVPGSGYGLGIIWHPTSCGGGYWNHEGDTFGFLSLNAVSDDGGRAVVVFQTTNPAGPAIVAEDLQLLDDVMCAGR
jgi:D-alanyl-D-alanine carboxypeptidase